MKIKAQSRVCYSANTSDFPTITMLNLIMNDISQNLIRLNYNLIILDLIG